MSVTVEQDINVQTPALSGSAQFPSGTTATLTNQLSGGRFALGGSEYIVTLNAVKSNPTGAHLVLTFAGGT